MDVPDAGSNGGSEADRRRLRRPVNMRGYLIREGGISHAIEVTDLNYGGCGIQSSIELRPGESVKLSVLGRGTIPAQVRWFNDGQAGLDFDSAVQAGRKQIPRRNLRVAVPGEIGLRSVGRNSYRVRVLDLSTDGCKVELVERPSVGDRMLVKFDGLEPLDADVCWIDGHTAGLEFQHPIHPAVYDLLLRRLSANAESGRTG
jgi:hypothetical protein